MNQQTTIGNFVKENFNTSIVFSQLGIDFCCGGNITLEQACHNNQLNVEEVLAQLKEVKIAEPIQSYAHMSAQSLIHQIVQVHHKYILSTAPAIQTYLKKLVARHGEIHPELLAIDQLFDEAIVHLTDHMQREEMILFPYVEAMEEAVNHQFDLAAPHFGHVDHPIAVMEEDHQTEGDRFKQIAALSNNYTVPEDGCETYSVTFSLLRAFEHDLHTHVHLENNILFPKAKQLFASISKKE